MQSLRLKLIADLVDKNSIVADIGTDHGIVPIYLSKEKICKKIIASDISEKSLNKLYEKLELNPQINNIDLRVGNGLNILKPFEVDTIIISGMGGNLIEEIIEESLEVAKSSSVMILGANNAVEQLRRFLHLKRFIIVDEVDLYENDKYYQILKVKTGLEVYEEDIYYEFGKILIEKKSKNLLKFINEEINSMNNIVEHLNSINTESSKERLETLDSKLNLYKKVRDMIEA
ncbi:MAG: SAM-dependent methyltransferase [Tissierellia bacterium]|nr:SAM-dependent methyltransferase [Tissierellia bacterium]